MRPEDEYLAELKRQLVGLRDELARLQSEISRLQAAENAREVLVNDLRRALHQVQTPEIVTMCSHCKGIKGADLKWRPPEHLLQARFGLAVSHGICPDCRDAFYPDLPRMVMPKGLA